MIRSLNQKNAQNNWALRLFKTVILAAVGTSSLQAADYVKGYTRGSASELMIANGGTGSTLFVDQARTGGGDMVANGGNPIWGWEIDGSDSWSIGDKVEFTGIAVPFWANDPTTDGTNNTQNATHQIRIYSCGSNDVFEGTGVETLLGTVEANFVQADAGVDEYYVNFDDPVEWASADSTCFYFYIQAIDSGSGTAMRIKTGGASTSVIKSRTDGTVQNVGGSTTTALSVAGSVNRVERTWFGDNENAISAAAADWDTSLQNWDAGAAAYTDGEFATFDESFDGSSANVNLIGVLSPGAIVVNNGAVGSVPEYRFSGTGGFTGDGGLVKQGDGVLVLENLGLNDYSGGTLIENGTIRSGATDALPFDGNLTIGGAAGASVFAMNGFDQTIANLFVSGQNTRRLINGSPTATVLTVTQGGVYGSQLGNNAVAATDDDNNFSLVKTGSGELNLVGSNSLFAGSTTITGGTVRISADNGLGAAPTVLDADAIILDGGSLRVHMANGTGGSFEIDSNRGITLGANGGTIQTTTPSGAWAVTYNGVITGTGSLTKSFAQRLVLGGVNDYQGDTFVTGGFLDVNGSALPDGTALTIDGGIVQATGTEVVDTLFFGSEQQVIGTWGATGSGADNIDDSRFAGVNGVVSVTNGPVFTPYESWANSNITLVDATAAAGFEDDADGDGLENGLEWVLGGDPLNGTFADAVTESADSAGGLTLVFERAADALSETTLSVEWSSDLEDFSNSIVISGTVAPNGIQPTVSISGDEVTVNIPAGNAGAGKLFARLLATEL